VCVPRTVNVTGQLAAAKCKGAKPSESPPSMRCRSVFNFSLTTSYRPRLQAVCRVSLAFDCGGAFGTVPPKVSLRLAGTEVRASVAFGAAGAALGGDAAWGASSPRKSTEFLALGEVVRCSIGREMCLLRALGAAYEAIFFSNFICACVRVSYLGPGTTISSHSHTHTQFLFDAIDEFIQHHFTQVYRAAAAGHPSRHSPRSTGSAAHIRP